MDLAQELRKILGPKGWLTGGDIGGHGRDWLDRYGEPPLGVARPASTAEVCQVLAACHKAGVRVVPQGGNTGLCAAAVCGQAGEVILSLARMNAIAAHDPASGTVAVEAGVVLASLHAALAPHGYDFPLHLGAEGTAQIGGLIGTNAGGSHALRFGMMQDLVIGLEVVLADGSLWDGLRAVQKDNAGYQLRKLFCGAEGTLGIVTRAILKIVPSPKQRMTALLALPDVAALVAAGTALRAEAGEFISGMEFMPELGMDLVLRHVAETSFPLQSRAPWYLLVEMTACSAHVPLGEIFEELLTRLMEDELVLDGTIAQSDSQRAALWRLREEQPEGQRLEGAQLKHDISVPPGKLAQFIAAAAGLSETHVAGVRVNAFGHLGDGNIHYNLTPPLGQQGFGDAAPALGLALAGLASEMGGSFAAEHGLGRAKIALADALRSPVERRLMAQIKAAFDPQATLNHGVMLRPE